MNQKYYIKIRLALPWEAASPNEADLETGFGLLSIFPYSSYFYKSYSSLPSITFPIIPTGSRTTTNNELIF